MNVLSIQSHVSYGHVGNSAAVFALQRLGCEVWPIHTVQFSNHTGYGSWGGQIFTPDLIRDVMRGLADRQVLARCDGVLTGYVGSVDLGEAILEAVAMVRAANPQTCYCCDPVMGDLGRGIYVRPDLPAFMRERAVPAADIVTPNQFELDTLTGRSTQRLAEILAAIDEIRARGPKVVLVTSARTEETPADVVDLIGCDAGGAYRVRTPRLTLTAKGAGDLLSALFLQHYLSQRSVAIALSLAASSIFGVLRSTAEDCSPEILLIAAQEELVAPAQMFRAELL